jgi:hypothetical protein
MTGKFVGWIVEVSHVDQDREPQRYYVAEPLRSQAVAAVRRRIPGADAARVEAVKALSRSQISRLRLMRGEVMLVN